MVDNLDVSVVSNDISPAISPLLVMSIASTIVVDVSFNIEGYI